MKFAQKLIITIIALQFTFGTFPKNYGFNFIKLNNVAEANDTDKIHDDKTVKAMDSALDAPQTIDSAKVVEQKFEELVAAFDAPPLDCFATLEGAKPFVNMATTVEEIQKDDADFKGTEADGTDHKMHVVNCQKDRILLAGWFSKLQKIAKEAQAKKGGNDCATCSVPGAEDPTKKNTGNFANFQNNSAEEAVNKTQGENAFCSEAQRNQLKKEKCDVSCGFAKQIVKDHPRFNTMVQPFLQPTHGAECAGDKGSGGSGCVSNIMNAFTGSLWDAGVTATELAGGVVSKILTNPWKAQTEAEKKLAARQMAIAKANDKQVAAAAAHDKRVQEGALQNLGEFFWKSMKYLTNIQMFEDLGARLACSHCADFMNNWCNAIGVLGKDLVVNIMVGVALGGAMGLLEKGIARRAELKALRKEAQAEKNGLSKAVSHTDVGFKGRIRPAWLNKWNDFITTKAGRRLTKLFETGAYLGSKVMNAVAKDPTMIAIDGTSKATKGFSKFFLGVKDVNTAMVTDVGRNEAVKAFEENHTQIKDADRMDVAMVPKNLEENIVRSKRDVIKAHKATPYPEANKAGATEMIKTSEVVQKTGNAADKKAAAAVEKRYKAKLSEKETVPLTEEHLADIENAEVTPHTVIRNKKGQEFVEVADKDGVKHQYPITHSQAKTGDFEVLTANEGKTVIVRNKTSSADAKIYFRDADNMVHRVEVKPNDLNEMMGKTVNGNKVSKEAMAEIKQNLEMRDPPIKYTSIKDPVTGEEHIEVENGPNCTPKMIPIGAK